MSPVTFSDLSFLPRSSLAASLRTTPLPSSSSSSSCPIAVIDVRDSDYIGGHIRGSRHTPSNTLDHAIPELVRTLRDKETVVFHCTMSQQRGPSAALRYLRERERMLGIPAVDDGDGDGDGEGEGEAEGAVDPKGDVKVRDGDGNAGGDAGRHGAAAKQRQKVYVLDGGFAKWQEDYGRDERLTEGWVRDIWDWGRAEEEGDGVKRWKR
ncbi:hypothetical protein LTS18_011191 [Coniosporium uncinatum]|uniref:Uncharacterized protein n=1 Tax=Coniosporium uncinatum TaxID=93489 RepID=A0ACC3CYR7_9PEZI|nr:hypothetical protein LTS18_011191 [Coniosporium uncinatum]